MALECGFASIGCLHQITHLLGRRGTVWEQSITGLSVNHHVVYQCSDWLGPDERRSFFSLAHSRMTVCFSFRLSLWRDAGSAPEWILSFCNEQVCYCLDCLGSLDLSEHIQFPGAPETSVLLSFLTPGTPGKLFEHSQQSFSVARCLITSWRCKKPPTATQSPSPSDSQGKTILSSRLKCDEDYVEFREANHKHYHYFGHVFNKDVGIFFCQSSKTDWTLTKL